MNTVDFWLYLEPFVHTFVKEKQALLYNSLTGDYILISNTNAAYRLIKKLSLKKNLYVIPYKKNDDLELNEFIFELQNKYMGDLLNKNWSTKKPVQSFPIIKIEKSIDDEEYNKLYISELTLIINSNSNFIEENKQSLFCRNNFEITNSLDFNIIVDLINNTSVKIINILGANVFNYNKLSSLISLFESKNIHVNFYFNIDVDLNLTSILFNNNISSKHFNISISNDNILDKLSVLKTFFQEKGIDYSIDIRIFNESDFIYYDNITKSCELENVNFIPFFDGTNLDFFRDAVFLNKKDILGSIINQRDIFARNTINQHYFGRLFVIPNGNVYSNLNKSKVGNLYLNDIDEILHNELHYKKNWFKVRKNVTPCKSCIYNALCPPISNYEYAIGKYNLCHVWKD